MIALKYKTADLLENFKLKTFFIY